MNSSSKIFYSKINSIFSEIQETSNPQEKSNLIRKLTIIIWNELNANWSRKYNIEEYALEITNCIIQCTKLFAKEKGYEFSNYVIAALKNELKNARKKENSYSENQIPIVFNNEKNEENYITDFFSVSVNYKKNISDEEKYFIFEELKQSLKILDSAIQKEKENKELKSAFITKDILTQLDKKNFLEIDLEKIIALEKQFSFLNKKIWHNFFSERELPTQEMIAAVFGCSKSNASKMMSRFYERLKIHAKKLHV